MLAKREGAKAGNNSLLHFLYFIAPVSIYDYIYLYHQAEIEIKGGRQKTTSQLRRNEGSEGSLREVKVGGTEADTH